MKPQIVKENDYLFSLAPSVLKTKVKSSIAITIWDQVRKHGGMCICSNSCKDGFIGLLRELKQKGSLQKDLQIKMIGGAYTNKQTKNPSVGKKNIEFAEQLLLSFGLSIASMSVGGECSRKVQFNTETGRVMFMTQPYQIKESFQEPNKKASKLIKVLIVDDSKTIRTLIEAALSAKPDFKVIGKAKDPIQAMELIDKEKPDVITLDIKMPRMDGITFIKQYISKNFFPVVILSSLSQDELQPTLEALSSGAFHYLEKPKCSFEVMHFKEELRRTVFHANKHHLKGTYPIDHKTPKKNKILLNSHQCKGSLLTIGASTGGVQAMERVIQHFSEQIPPTFCILHIPAAFSSALADRWNEQYPFQVKEAVDKMAVEAGMLVIAPGSKHMQVKEARNGDLFVRLTDDPPINRFKPSIDYSFSSINKLNRHIIAVLLTGMGADGAKGLLDLKKNGAHTIAQDKESSAVYGMPKVAAELGAADLILPIDEICLAIEKKLKILKKAS